MCVPYIHRQTHTETLYSKHVKLAGHEFDMLATASIRKCCQEAGTTNSLVSKGQLTPHWQLEHSKVTCSRGWMKPPADICGEDFEGLCWTWGVPEGGCGSDLGQERLFGSLYTEAPPFPSVSGVAFVLLRVSAPQSCAKLYVLEGQSNGASFLLRVWGYICPSSESRLVMI